MRKLYGLITLCLAISAAAQAAEFRGLWVDAWNPGFRTADETTAMIEKAKECNFNAIFVQIRKRADAYYRSKIEPTASDVAPDYDPLADVITKAHAAGIKVHAWVVVYEVYHDVPEKTPDPRLVHMKHPEWVMKDVAGKVKFPGDKIFLDPGAPGVTDYLVSIVEEIAKNYDVDGIHLDIARYPSREGGYADSAVAAYNKEKSKTGKPDKDDDDWGKWRAAKVTDFIVSACQAARKIKPKAQMSAAVFANRQDAAWHRLQDWEKWIGAGKLDFAVPMLFVLNNELFATTAADLVKSCKDRVYIGQASYKTKPADCVQQVLLARKAGAQGIVIYNYFYGCRAREPENVSPLDQLKADAFSKPDDLPEIGVK